MSVDATESPHHDSSDDVYRIELSGNITNITSQNLETKVLAEIESLQKSAVLLDLRYVKYIDSRGISFCIRIFKQCLARRKSFSMEVNPVLFTLFASTNLTKAMNIKEVAV